MGKPVRSAAGRQRQREVGDQQRFAHFRFSAHKQNSLRRQQSGFHQAGRRVGGCCSSSWASDRTLGSAAFCVRGAHSSASVVASSRMASSTTAALRAAARRKAVRASLLTLRRMPLVA